MKLAAIEEKLPRARKPRAPKTQRQRKKESERRRRAAMRQLLLILSKHITAAATYLPTSDQTFVFGARLIKRPAPQVCTAFDIAVVVVGCCSATVGENKGAWQLTGDLSAEARAHVCRVVDSDVFLARLSVRPAPRGFALSSCAREGSIRG